MEWSIAVIMEGGGVLAAVGGACVLLRAEKGPETTRNDLPFLNQQVKW
jgi:hypothetical protein